MPGGVGVGQIVAATAERRKPARAPGVITGPAGWRWLLLAGRFRIARSRAGYHLYGGLLGRRIIRSLQPIDFLKRGRGRTFKTYKTSRFWVLMVL
jgi:hypothetical protein